MKQFQKRLAAVLFASLLATTTATSVVTAQEFDQEFFAGNDILFYDPRGCTGGAAGVTQGSIEGNDNLEKILRYFTSQKGLSLAQAAGIAGNMKQESGFDPTIIQGGRKAPDNYVLEPNVGFGLVQWTSPGRQQNLMEYARKTNRKITDLTMQLDFVWKEMTTSYKRTVSALKKATDPVEAAIIVHGPPYPGYEASADSAEFVRRVRGGNAKKYYEQFKGKIQDGNGSVASESGTSGGACAETASEFTADGFVVYNQCDPRWANVAYSYKTACSSGCGPTAMAAAITALTGKRVTPKETVKYASDQGMYVSGVGSSHQVPPVLAKHWNVNAKPVDKSEAAINKVLRGGGLVILAGTGAAPFTGAGHYILIRGVTGDGKWKIADSNGQAGQENSKKAWDPSQILIPSVGPTSIYGITK